MCLVRICSQFNLWRLAVINTCNVSRSERTTKGVDETTEKTALQTATMQTLVDIYQDVNLHLILQNKTTKPSASRY